MNLKKEYEIKPFLKIALIFWTKIIILFILQKLCFQTPYYEFLLR
jgi:hypothetical protein